jgi:hypothetical protein
MRRGGGKVGQVGFPLRRQGACSVVSVCDRVYASFGSPQSVDPARRTDLILIVIVMLRVEEDRNQSKRIQGRGGRLA